MVNPKSHSLLALMITMSGPYMPMPNSTWCGCTQQHLYTMITAENFWGTRSECARRYALDMSIYVSMYVVNPSTSVGIQGCGYTCSCRKLRRLRILRFYSFLRSIIDAPHSVKVLRSWPIRPYNGRNPLGRSSSTLYPN